MTPPRRGTARSALFLGCLVFVVYNSNFRAVTSGDCYPARFIPLAVLRGGSLTLEPVAEAIRVEKDFAYSMAVSVTGKPVSLFPVVVPVLVTPLYVPSAFALRLLHWREPYLSRIAAITEKLSASIVAAGFVALLYVLLRRRMRPSRAALLALAFGLGTNTWVTGSQGLWQHGTAELLLALALLCVTGEPTAGSSVVLGGACALAALNRPPDAILALAIGVEGLLRARRLAPVVIASAVVASAPFLAYNWTSFHDLAGGYAWITRASAGKPGYFERSEILPGLAALLFSSGKGLFFFSPFLAFLAGNLRPSPRARRDRRLGWLLVAAISAQLLLYSRTDWRAGDSFGPRYLVDILPLLAWLVAPVVERLGKTGLPVFVGAVFLSVGVQAVGAFCYPTGQSDRLILPKGPESMETNVWKLSEAPVVVEARAGLAPMKFIGYAKKGLAGVSQRN